MIAIKNTFFKWSSYFRSTGVLLLVVTIISLLLSNSSYSENYIRFWNMERFTFAGHKADFIFLINDFLMAIFFLNVGLEIKRELIIGELSSFKKSITPIIAAIGGMIIPALIYYALKSTCPIKRCGLEPMESKKWESIEDAGILLCT